MRIGNLRGVKAELVGDETTAGVPLLGRRRVAKGFLALLSLLPLPFSALTGEDAVGCDSNVWKVNNFITANQPCIH